MANRRMINKDDLDSPNFGELTIQQRYLFWAIMLNADDDGIMPVNLVKAKCFPYDEEISREEILNDLEKLKIWNYIGFYNEKKYLEVLGWWPRQFIDLKLYKPTAHPKPPTYKLRPKNLSKDRRSRKILEQNREDKVSEEQNSLEKMRGDETSKELAPSTFHNAQEVFYPNSNS
jgi:hypothetical protein